MAATAKKEGTIFKVSERQMARLVLVCRFGTDVLSSPFSLLITGHL